MFAQLYQNTILKNPKSILTILLIILISFGYHAKDFRLDASSETLLIEGDPDLKYLTEVNERYGSKEFLVLTYTPNEVITSDNSINNFRFNVSIALFYEIFSFFKDSINKEVSNLILRESVIKIMIIMSPFIPHLANECLENLKCKNADSWPVIDKLNILDEVKIAIQVNGKTRDIISIKKNMSEKETHKLIIEKSKAKKYIENKKINKTIFVKNKIINYILK